MTEEQIRRIVRDEIWNEVNREGGLADHLRGAALNMLEPQALDEHERLQYRILLEPSIGA